MPIRFSSKCRRILPCAAAFVVRHPGFNNVAKPGGVNAFRPRRTVNHFLVDFLRGFAESYASSDASFF